MVRDVRETRYGSEFIAKVLESRAPTPLTHAIKVERPPRFRFGAVQFTFLSIRTPEAPDWSDYRPMSLACAPTRGYLEYGVRIGVTPWKRAFVALRPGDEVMVEGPVGHFLLDESRPAVFVAGGIGITPLKGMIEYATDSKLPIPLRLLYSNRSSEEIAFRAELDALARLNPAFKVEHTITRDDPSWKGRRGRVDEATLKAISQGLTQPVYYLCGAPGLVDGVRSNLQALGVPDADVRFEHFWGYEGEPPVAA
ncbi:MAG: ferredoxin--NADP reductase [Thermoplasmatota archaeon]